MLSLSLSLSSQVAEFPESHVASIEWPFHDAWSVAIGKWKCYPALFRGAPRVLGVTDAGEREGG